MKILRTLFVIGVILYSIWYVWGGFLYSLKTTENKEVLTEQLGYPSEIIVEENCLNGTVIPLMRNDQIKGYGCLK